VRPVLPAVAMAALARARSRVLPKST